MPTYHLDTNVCIALINGSSPQIRARFRSTIDAGSTVAVSSVAIDELWYGVEKSAKRDFNRERLETFLRGPLDIVAFDEEDAPIAGQVRADLERGGKPIGAYDILIASQAKRHEATLVTSNTEEFKRVKGLRMEDWEISEET